MALQAHQVILMAVLAILEHQAQAAQMAHPVQTVQVV
jgi:hypothetical protein